MVYSSPLMTPSQVKAMDRPDEKVVRVEYKGKKDYKILAKDLGIMDDVKVSWRSTQGQRIEVNNK